MKLRAFLKMRLSRAGGSLAIALALACSDATEPVDQPANRVTALQIISGAEQTGEEIERLPEPLVVRAVDAQGFPVAGAPVIWRAEAAGASVEGDSITDANGYARAFARIGLLLGPQRFTASVLGNQASFDAYLRIGEAAITPVAATLWVGESLKVTVVATSSLGNPVPGPFQIRTNSVGVAQVDSDGSVRAVSPGSATITVVGMPSVQMPVIVTPVGLGDSISITLHNVGNEPLRDVTVLVDGRAVEFGRAGNQLAIPLKQTLTTNSTVQVTVIAATATRALHPATLLIRAPDIRSNLDLVLVPRSWTVQRGLYAGQHVDISMNAAMNTTCTAPGLGTGFYQSMYIEDRYTLNVFGWTAAAFPLRVTITNQENSPAVTAAERAFVWSTLDSLEVIFGRDLFVPAEASVASGGEALFTIGTNWSGGGQISTVHEFAGQTPSWGNRGAQRYSVRYADFTRAQVEVGDNATFPREQRAVTYHETMHALGFGHGCIWPSIQNLQTPVPTSVDVAYAELYFEVFERERQLGSYHAFLAALMGERGQQGLPLLP